MLSGSLSDYDEAARLSVQTVLAREADVEMDAVYLTLIAGSVIVEADIHFATADGATYAVSQLLAGIFASAAALETALSVQFDMDRLSTTASVQQILSAPEYVTVDKAMIGIGVGVGVGVGALLLVVSGVALRRRRKRAPPLPRAGVQSVPVGALVAAGVPVGAMDPTEVQLVQGAGTSKGTDAYPSTSTTKDAYPSGTPPAYSSSSATPLPLV